MGASVTNKCKQSQKIFASDSAPSHAMPRVRLSFLFFGGGGGRPGQTRRSKDLSQGYISLGIKFEGFQKTRSMTKKDRQIWRFPDT